MITLQEGIQATIYVYSLIGTHVTNRDAEVAWAQWGPAEQDYAIELYRSSKGSYARP